MHYLILCNYIGRYDYRLLILFNLYDKNNNHFTNSVIFSLYYISNKVYSVWWFGKYGVKFLQRLTITWIMEFSFHRTKLFEHVMKILSYARIRRTFSFSSRLRLVNMYLTIARGFFTPLKVWISLFIYHITNEPTGNYKP